MKLFVGIYSWAILNDNKPITNNDLIIFAEDDLEDLGISKYDDDSIYGVPIHDTILKLEVGEELVLEEPFNGQFVFARFDGNAEMLTKFRLKWLTKWLAEIIQINNETIDELKETIKSYSYKQLSKEELSERDKNTPHMVDWTENATRDELLSHIALKDTEEIRELL